MAPHSWLPEPLNTLPACSAEPWTEPLAPTPRLWPHVLHLSLQVIENCVAAAGFSVGEFAALVFAGAMEFSEGTQEGFGFVPGCFLAGFAGDQGHCQK